MTDFALRSDGDDGDDPFYIYTGLSKDRQGHATTIRWDGDHKISVMPSMLDRINDVVRMVPKFHSAHGFLRSEGMHGLKKWEKKLAQDGTGVVDILALTYIMEEEARDRDRADLRTAVNKLRKAWARSREAEQPALRLLAREFQDRLALMGMPRSESLDNIIARRLYVADPDS